MRVLKSLEKSVALVKEKMDKTRMIYEQEEYGLLFGSFTRLYVFRSLMERIEGNSNASAQVKNMATDFKRTVGFLIVETTMCQEVCQKVNLHKISNLT